jgi:predicted porin
MNKKLMAIAVAGALAAPGVALAQASSVTISGIFKLGVENISYGNNVSTRLNKSQTRVVDNSSRVIFNTVEDLGNGLAAIGQLDVRFAPDQASSIGATLGNPIGSGNSWVGLRSRSWGTLTVGRWDLHYGKGPSEMTRGAGALQASDVSLFDFIGATPIANASRTQNVVKYDSPNWAGFDATIAYSANPSNAVGGEADMTASGSTNSRRGDAWNINPRFTMGPFAIEYSYWKAKPDAPTAIPAVTATTTLVGVLGSGATAFDQQGHSLTGKYTIGGLKVGIGANRSRLNPTVNTADFGTGDRLERTTWSVAGQYNWGPHTVFAHYDRAARLKSNLDLGDNNTSAKMVAVAYEYSLSKRTSLGVTYAQIKNDSDINYNLFTSSALGSADTATQAGEDPRIFQVTILHRF